MDISFDVEVHNKKLEWLRPALVGWGTCIDRYCHSFPNKEPDAPYYYNERANISLLAGGAWLNGMIVLEEYQADKQRESEVSGEKGKQYVGRADLYIAEASCSGESAVLEAKQVWLNMESKRSSVIKKTVKKNEEAKKAAIEGMEKDCQRIALTFVSPKFGPGHVSLDQDCLDLVNSLKDGVKNDLIAWSFPKMMRKNVYVKEGKEKWYAPGLIVLMSLV